MECGMLEMWDVRDVECWGCGMSADVGVWAFGCLGFGMLGIWNVWDVE